MANVELVIKINEDTYKAIQRRVANPKMMRDKVDIAIANGTPLPKGHEIIDKYALQEHLALVPMEDRTYREAVEIIDWFPSIIEADKGESEADR